MKDVNHAIAVLRDLTGLPVLELNANGHLELIFDDKISIDLVKIDDNHIELSSPLDIADLENVNRLQTLLTANYHGSGTGFGRIAMDRATKAR
jgi:Tir chaperone protein (CesT) family